MQSLIRYWHLDGLMAVFLDGLMAVFLIGLCIGYFYLVDFKIERKSKYFFSGYTLIILAVASPLHFLGENYLMSAHMATHVILLLIAAPLLVVGFPENGNKNIRVFSAWLSRHPWFPWITGVCTMWFWHVPVIFNWLLWHTDAFNGGFISINIRSDIHLISLLLTGMLFSWPVAGPVKSSRITPVNAVLYLSAACIFCSLLGLMITFSPGGIYTPYEHITDRFGFLHMIRDENGLTSLVDRQMAGLIMWVPGCLIYLSASIYILMKWFKEKREQPVFTTNPLDHD
jgi:putative membrane protein